MKADVTHVSYHEGTPWHTWPFRPEVKPSNTELLTGKCKKHMTWTTGDVSIKFHALKLSDGSEWDSWNGFRGEYKGPR